MDARGRSLALVALFALAFLAVGCGDDGDDDGTEGVGLALEKCGDLEYGGDGDPDAVIVSDLPMQGDSAERSEQQVEAIRLELEQRGWAAGDTSVGFQSCDDSIADTGLWDEDTCRSNAEAYAGDDQVLGVIGTYNSGCAAIEIPILNRAPVAMISPGNTAVCLTEESRTCEDYSPRTLYPSGERNYARVVPNDAFQGAALAEFTARQGSRRPYILYAADDPTSTGQATNFRGAAEALGLEVAGYETWDPEAADYRDLFAKVARTGADAVVLAGLTEQNGGRLIRDKVSEVGANGEVPLVAFDGFAQQATIDDAGSAARGMYAGLPGSVPQELPDAGASFVAELEGRLDGQPVEQFAPPAGEATAVLLDAIEEAGTDRATIAEAVLTTRVTDGILGSYEIEPSGDPSVGPVTILKAGSTFEPVVELRPPQRLVRAARG